MNPVEKVLEAVDDYEERANGYWCVCPAHDDHNPSLHVEMAEDGSALFVCRAGCEQADVLAALERRGLKPRDLFAETIYEVSPNGHSEGAWSASGGHERRAAAYAIKDSSGRLVAIHERYEGPSGKRFLWKLPSGEYSKRGEIRPAALPLYGSELVVDWPEDQAVILVEGEKAADALRSAGLRRALGTVTGANGTHDAEALKILAGRRVIFWPDNDAPGRRHMHRHAERLRSIASAVHWYEWERAPEKDDAADHPAVVARDRAGLVELAKQLREAPTWEPSKRAETKSSVETRDPRQGVTFSSAAELMLKEIPPVRWVVPGILPEGVALLAGKPKLGKSWLALGLCTAVAAGGYALGNVPVERGAALYMALEDSERRLQSRLRKVLGEVQPPAGLDYTTLCPRLNEGGLEAIARWLEAHPDARLVVLDTMAKIRPRTSGKNVYQEDYEALEKLLPLAADHNAAIVVVHHLRKQGASDPLDEVNSSIGLTGGVDGVLILKRDRTRADASLFVTGRDVEEEKDLALRWSPEVGTWTLVGDAEEYRASQERQEILDYVRRAGGPVGPKEVATGLEKNYKTVAALMQKMLNAGALSSPAYGKYEAANLEPAVEVPTILTVPTVRAGQQNSPADFPMGSVGTVRTSLKTAHSRVGSTLRTWEEQISGENLEGLKELLSAPPEWLRRQVRKHLEDPREGTLKALCTAVAYEIFGDPRRGQEIRPALEEAMEKWESP
jgi:5S rRNA maturation endonuclease (ribonuclease M5)